MKTNQRSFHCFAVIYLVGAFYLQGADLTNTTTVVQESWETISNRWSSSAIEKIKGMAEGGDVSAQYYLAVSYSKGNRTAKDQEEAFKWMKLAAQQGMARAQRKLGWMLQNGSGIETNLDEAVSWYEKSATQGDAEAQFNLGWMFKNGIGVSQDYAEAAKYYRQAAEQGHAMAQNNLGWLYKNGWGVPDNQQEALKWFQKSADQGEPLAQKNLAWIYAAGVYGEINTNGQGAEAQIKSGGIAPNHELAEKWMRQAVDLNSAEGQYQFAELIYGEFDNGGFQDTTRFSEAAEWFRKAAEQGYAKAQYQLADMYNTGKLGDDQRTNCIPWFLKAAAQGNAEAQAEVGELPVFYPNNELLTSVSNIEMLRQSGEQGNLMAQYQLARRYQIGVGVSKDLTEAFKWMQKAAHHSQDESSLANFARYYLALMYETGEGVTQNITNAWQLYWEAALANWSYSPDAAFRVGQMFENGENVPQDDYRAVVFYYGAVGQGDGGFHRYEAIENIFKLYSNGRGLCKTNLEPDYYVSDRNLTNKESVIEQLQGEITTPQGEFYVGTIYYQGTLVPQNLVEAAARFKVAANHNSGEAHKMLDQIESELSPAQNELVKTRSENLGKQLEQTRGAFKLKQKFELVKPW